MKEYALSGNEFLGIEFGSTRIKAVLTDSGCKPLAFGSYEWENKHENGVWTYDLNLALSGLQQAYAELNAECEKLFHSPIKTLGAIGISGMMHGYIALDSQRKLLCPFRTWRNTITAESSKKLTELFGFNIPQRWTVAHLHKALLDGEEHISKLSGVTTLAGYIHYLLTGKNVVGIGEASGIFPIDKKSGSYNGVMADKFDSLPEAKNAGIHIRDLLPAVLCAGENAGSLTPEGAKILDVSGNLQPGAIFCPPEGDAGTGMAATNSVLPGTGNISAGTSVFSMIVLEDNLKNVYPEIDVVATPDGSPVAMVHCNNCCTDLDYWMRLFASVLSRAGCEIKKSELYNLMYNAALEGKPDCGGIVNFNYFSGEPVSHTADGRPLLVRKPGSEFTLPDFMRSQIYSAVATLRIGMDLLERENIKINRLTGHGGLFKTPVVGQRFVAAAAKTPVSVMKTAGEGGPWGAAILAAYTASQAEMPLAQFLEEKVFADSQVTTVNPEPEDEKGFDEYMKLYKSALNIQKAAPKYI